MYGHHGKIVTALQPESLLSEQNPHSKPEDP